MAGGKGNTHSTDLLSLILNAVAIANEADNAATSPLTQLWLSLHTADPGAAGTQTTSEIAYTGYARVAINRSPGSPQWTVSNPGTPQAVNAGAVNWPACTAGSGTALYVMVGTASSGAGKQLYRALVGTPTGGLAISAGITPTSPAGDIVFTEQ